MVLFELLSQRSPFDDVHPVMKRNYEVRDGHRPTLQAKETRTLIRLQELMELCWDKDPETRPKMGQVVEWIHAPEFERLRAEIALREVKSVSCACVCRILPEYEPNSRPNFSSQSEVGSGRGLDSSGELEEIGSLGSLIERFSGAQASIDLIVPNMLPSVSDSICIENLEGKRIGNDGDDVYPFLPSKLCRKSIHGRERRPSAAKLKDEGREPLVESVGTDTGDWIRDTDDRRRDRRDTDDRRNIRKDTGDTAERSVRSDMLDRGKEGKFDPYTQIWMCGRDQRKGMLQIFTYNDGHPGNYVSYLGG